MAKEWWEEDFALPVLGLFAVGAYLVLKDEKFGKPKALSVTAPVPGAQLSPGTSDSMMPGAVPGMIAPPASFTPPTRVPSYISRDEKYYPPAHEVVPLRTGGQVVVTVQKPALPPPPPEFPSDWIVGGSDPVIGQTLTIGPDQRVPYCVDQNTQVIVQPCPSGQHRPHNKMLVHCKAGEKSVPSGGGYACRPEYSQPTPIGTGRPGPAYPSPPRPPSRPPLSRPTVGGHALTISPQQRVPDCVSNVMQVTVQPCPPGQHRSCHKKLVRCGVGQQRAPQGGCGSCRGLNALQSVNEGAVHPYLR